MFLLPNTINMLHVEAVKYIVRLEVLPIVTELEQSRCKPYMNWQICRKLYNVTNVDNVGMHILCRH